MTTDDARDFSACLTACAEAFGEAISEARLLLYFHALADLTLEQVEAGVTSAIRFSHYFPRPIELREWATGCAADLELDAETAWLSLLSEARAGYWHSPTFADGVTVAAITAVFGSWPQAVDAFCDLSEPAWQAKRKEFLAAYRALRHRGTMRGPASLVGMCAHQNALTGWTPARIAALRERPEPKALAP